MNVFASPGSSVNAFAGSRSSGQSIAVNPAFLQEIKDSNPNLWQSTHRLRQTCESGDPPVEVTRRLVRQLDKLRDQLAQQFALEESYGYLAVPYAVDERVDELSRLAHSQHCSLYLEISELVEHAEELQYRGVVVTKVRELVEAASAFEERLRDHEQIENDLVDRCFELTQRAGHSLT